MDPHNDKCTRLILAVLAYRGDSDPSSRNIANGALSAWRRLDVHLSALVGEAGFGALYSRSIRQVQAHHSGLTLTSFGQSCSVSLDALEKDLLAMGPAMAAAANRALLETFARLLSGLIGEALTLRLLNTAWANEPEGNTQ